VKGREGKRQRCLVSSSVGVPTGLKIGESGEKKREKGRLITLPAGEGKKGEARIERGFRGSGKKKKARLTRRKKERGKSRA